MRADKQSSIVQADRPGLSETPSVSNRPTRKSCRRDFGGEVRVKIVGRTHRRSADGKFETLCLFKGLHARGYVVAVEGWSSSDYSGWVAVHARGLSCVTRPYCF